MAETNYEREIAAVTPPNLTDKIELSDRAHLTSLKAGEIAASHTQYADHELTGYATVQNSAFFGSSLVAAAYERLDKRPSDIDGVELIRTMLDIVEEAQLPFAVSRGQERGGGHAA